MTGFDPKAYWENHLRNRPGLMATGHRQFSMAYNEAMYQIATERLQSALTQARIELRSYFPASTSGWLLIALYMVGTPG